MSHKARRFERNKPRKESPVQSRRLSADDLPPKPQAVQARHIEPLTENQDLFLRAYRKHQLVVSVGSAGAGKTYLGVNAAINDMATDRNCERLILTRANIPTGASLGAFPGTVEEKLAPWLAPMLSEIKKRVGSSTYDYWLRSGRILMQPLETIRGQSYDNSRILVDEAQNLTEDEIRAVTTRIGENSKMTLMGDLTQRDTVRSGLAFMMETIAKNPRLKVPLILFETKDIVRSDIVADLVRAYMKDSEDLYAKFRQYAWTDED